MWFTRISIKYPVFAVMMMASLVVLGILGYQRLSIEQLPNVEFPIVVVQTTYPGADPETVESEVTRKLEEEINTVSNIQSLTSRSYEGISAIIVQFDYGVDTRQMAQEIREKVALIRSSLRDEVKDPEVFRYDPNADPVLSIAVSSSQGRSLRELSSITDQIIKKRLSTVRGVGSVSLVGQHKREIQIKILPDRLSAYGVGVDQVLNVLQNETQNLPVGNVKNLSRDLTVQIKGRIKSISDFENLIVAKQGSLLVRLSDVAQVVDGEEEIESKALLNEVETVGLQVIKAQGENTVAVVQGLKERIDELNRNLPPDIKISVVRDASIAVEKAVNNVKQTIYEGALLTVLIVFLFLGSWRSTVITSLTLPIAILGTFFFMYVMNFSINMITLMAMSLCVGLLIDDAIVVRENIVRHNLMGKDHYRAALEGTQEIGLAVFATTLSIVAVFFPIGFMGGLIGQFFHQFGLTVVVAILISMFVSFTLDPMLSSVWHDPDLHGAQGKLAKLLHPFERVLESISNAYQSWLRWSLKHRWKTIGIAFLTLVVSIFLMRFVGTEFVPAVDYAEAQISLETPEGSSLEQTEQKVQEVLTVLKTFPEISYTYTTMGNKSGGKNGASIFVKLTPKSDREKGLQTLSQDFRARLSSLSGVRLDGIGQADSVGGDKQIEFSLMGTDTKTLELLTTQIREKLKQIHGLVDVDTNFKPSKPTIDLVPKREVLADMGVTVNQLNTVLRPLLSGSSVSVWRSPEDETYDVRVRLPKKDRMDVSQILALNLSVPSTGSGTHLVSLSQLVDVKSGLGPTTLYRRDLQKEILLSANVFGRDAGSVSADIVSALKTVDFPPGYHYQFQGATKDQAESMGYAAGALLLAIVFIYMILASQFNSFIQPISIMSSLPLTLIGVVIALLAFRSTINLFSIIGIVMLMGLVTKNAILLVDYTNQMRKEGMDKTQALLMAAKVRLRPILMTTLAMVFGMIPLALGLSEGSEHRAPLGQAVIGGVITSSILTLVVVPVIYSGLDGLVNRFKRRFSKTENNQPF